MNDVSAGIAPIWFGVFEAVFVVAFIGISVAVHLLGVLKTDDDAVTIYHKIHKEIIAQQERNFMAQKKENFL
ncbi:unnamed protein product [Nippostrongylus brasiliensis]|uniref:Phage protein n=1 Tax=Nippostrongylus brasiliensis TaxID=27835 RepID=A0A0N4Y5J5_NIPBR|nr:unnamed protein product [Nippostrongylus brasiliensis]